jgi:hypothetical protein
MAPGDLQQLGDATRGYGHCCSSSRVSRKGLAG